MLLNNDLIYLKSEHLMSKTIFMIHGMWGGPWYWQNFISSFEKREYRCVATTLRHHNVSPQDPPPEELGTTSILDYAADLEKEIKNLDEKPIIMGHSMGGLLGQILANRQLAQKLVLLAPASPAGILALKPSVIKSFSDVLMRPGFWKNPHRLSFEKAVYSMLHLLPHAEQEEVYSRFVYESGRAAFEIGFWLFDKNRATAVIGQQVKCPVLVLAGSEDRITPASVIKKVAQKYAPRSTYKEFPGHAHWLPDEPGWEDIAEYILKWLEGNG